MLRVESSGSKIVDGLAFTHLHGGRRLYHAMLPANDAIMLCVSCLIFGSILSLSQASTLIRAACNGSDTGRHCVRT